MSKFAERLSELMSESQLNQKMLAEKIEISETSLSHYLQDKHAPTVESLIKIADFFRCSTDYLLGREEDNGELNFKSCPPFSKQIDFLRDYYKVKPYQIYNGTDISKSCYYDWKSGKRQPSLDNIIRLADIFGCRIDFVLGRES